MSTAIAPRPAASGFTLVELLVVVGIIAVLISILLPSLNKARQQAISLKCQANLHTLGLATQQYMGANKGYMPYTTTTLWPEVLWFNAVDPYLGAKAGRTGAGNGVAADRSYKDYKQCPVYENFMGDQYSGGQNATKEFARTYKMNSHLRVATAPTYSFISDYGPPIVTKTSNYVPANAAKIREASRVVYLGDGVSLDSTGNIPSQPESGQFSMEVNATPDLQANPSLRHMGGANILFVDGHVERVVLKTIDKKLMMSPATGTPVKSWQGEFLDASGAVAKIDGVDPLELPRMRTKSIEQLGYKRNPEMPLIWSIPGKFYR